MVPINTAQDLINAFGVPDANYVSPVVLSDTRAGFSIQRDYPSDIRFKPARNCNGVADDVAVIWVTYKGEKQDGQTGHVPIRVRVAKMSKYRTAHWDYDFSDVESPTKDSVEASQKSPQPLSVEFSSSFYYSPAAGAFHDASGKSLSGRQILDSAYEAHCNTVHPLKGLVAHGEIALHEGFHKSLTKTIEFLTWLLKYVFGRTLDETPDRSILSGGYERSSFKKLGVDSVEVAGYRASKSVVVVFACLIVLLGCTMLPPTPDSYLSSLLASEFLVLVHALLLLIVLDELIPLLIFWAINALINLRRWYFSWRFKNGT